MSPDSTLLESIFCLVEALSLQKVVKMLKEEVVGWWEVRWNMADEAKLYSPIRSTSEALVVQKNWALSVAMPGNFRHGYSQYISLILLSILLRCDGCTGIQNAVVDQMGSRPPKSDHDHFFFWCKFGFGKCCGASQPSHWAAHDWLSYKTHFLTHVTIWSRNGSLSLHRVREDTSKRQCFDFLSAHEALTHQAKTW